MAEIRCQMCGKLNPSNLDVCQFCQARLRPVWAPAQPEEEPLAGSGEEGDEIPEWLRSLRSPDMGVGETGSGSSGLDWLGEVEPDNFAPDAVKNVFDLEPEEKLDDWLSGAASLAESEPPKAEDSFEQVRSDLSFLEETPFSSAAPEEETPDWLDRFRSEQEETSERMDFSPGEQEQTSAEEAPDWLARIQEAQTGDWSSSQEPASELESQPEETAPEFTPSEEGPDWFTEPAPTSAEGGEVFAEEEPDFGAIFSPETQPEAAESQQGVPDWLASLYSGQEEAPSPFMAEPEEAEPEAPGAAEQAELPDWLTGVTETASEQPAAASGIYTAPLEDELPETGAEGEAAEEVAPDWLSELETQGAATPEGQSSPPFTPAFDGFDLEEFSAGEEMPDWLSKLEASSSSQPSEEAVSAFLFEGEGETPFTTEPSGEAPPQVDAFAGLPEWLSEVTQAEEPEERPAEESEKAQALAPTELPSWLESMRPVESATPAVPFKDATDSRVERSGPLSGLSGVLPVGAHAIRAGKPSNFSIKLQVTEELQNRALLLQKLMEDESKPKPLPAPSAAPTPYLIRLSLFAVLAVAVFFALFLGGGQIPLPTGEAVPQALNDAYRQIAMLPDNAAVLLAVDYSPGYVGEIEGAAQAVVQHLASRGALLAAISSNPNGPAMAQRLFQSIDPAMAAGSQQHNLGYLPGGTAGLYGFAQSPETIIPFDLQGKPFWQQAPLTPQLGIRNFTMLVVMTENAETARTWIEQVAPAISPAPVLMVLSAQAEPMIQPYYQGNPQQVNGMVVGLPGGAAYESLINRPAEAARAWDAFSLLVTTSLAVLLIGSLASATLGAITRGRQSKGESLV